MGGVAGHMAHLSEDLDLTFDEIVSILSKVASADIKNTTEKVDGQNLFLTVANEEIRTARNKCDVEKGGMTTDEYISKWKGHPAENAFTNGFKAISAALRKLSPETLDDIFSNGQRYVNMEIMYPANPNIISYSAPNIVLHGLQYFGDEESSEQRGLAKEKFYSLVKAVDGGKQNVGKEDWNIHGPKIIALKKLADGTALEEVKSKIQSFASPVGMDATLGDYVGLVVKKYTEQVGLPNNILNPLLMLMLEPDEAKSRGIKVVALKKGLPKELQSVVSNLGSKTKSKKYIASVLRPLEIAISDFAIEVLRGVKSFFVDEHDEEVERMRSELQQSIVYLKSLQSSGDEKMGELIDKQLAKLGKIENLASSLEGVVFEYPPGSDRIYKLTGAFAMANQIIGRARRSGMTEDAEDELFLEIEDENEDPVVDADYAKTIAIVPGAFKPPHLGHVEMVKEYANIADQVIVLISSPTKAGRQLPNGREITAEDSLALWQLMTKNIPNVDIQISSHASPISAAYEFVGEDGPLSPGTKIILGASTKGGDWKRWTRAEKYVKQGVELVPPQESAVIPANKSDGQPYSATDLRNLLGNAIEHYNSIAEFVGEENVSDFLRVLGIEGPVREMSAMGAGSVTGASGKKTNKQDDEEESLIRENINLSTVDEVIRLIMERGILQ